MPAPPDQTAANAAATGSGEASWAGLGAIAAMAGAVGGGLVEGVRAATTGDEPLGLLPALLVAVHSAALFAAALVPLGAVFGAACKLLPPEHQPPALAQRLRDGMRRPEGGARLLGWLVGLGVTLVAAYVATRVVSIARNKDLAALTLTPMLLVALGVGWLASRSAGAAALPATRRLGWLGRGAGVAAALAGLGLVGAIIVAVALAELLKAIDLGFAWVAAGSLLAGAAALWWAPSRPESRKRAAIAAAFVLLMAAYLTLFHLRRDMEVLFALRSHSGLARFVLAAAATPLDGDGDGAATLLGGGDCDDHAPDIYPGAVDVPNNGIDEDCDGEDLEVSADMFDIKPSGADGGADAGPAAVKLPAMNVLHFMMDTFRWDKVGAERSGKPLTPRMVAFGEEALWFDYASSVGPNTKYTVPSMWTGKYFSEVPRNGRAWVAILDEATTIAERLHEAGVFTAAINGHFWVENVSNLKQGFEVFEGYASLVSGERIADRGIELLRERAKDGKPFYIWLHMYDAHNDFTPLPAWDIFGDCTVCRYDAEVRYVDFQIGRVLDELEKLGLDESTAVIIHSDHGEAFGEHGMTHHGTSLYWEQIRIPLMVRVPGTEPRRVADPVSIIDLPRTILELAGLQPPEEMQGFSLLPYATMEKPPRRPAVYAEIVRDPRHEDIRAWIEDDFKLIWWMKEGRVRLFNIKEDPTELKDLSGSKPEVVDRLKKRVSAYMATKLTPFDVTIIPEAPEPPKTAAPATAAPATGSTSASATPAGSSAPKSAAPSGSAAPKAATAAPKAATAAPMAPESSAPKPE